MLRQESELRAALDRRGWALRRTRSSAELAGLAESLGDLVPSHAAGPLIDEIRPKPTTEAPPRSLSAVHGLDPFPLHTDAAHHSLPPRYVLLRLASSTPTSCRTLVANLPQTLRKGDREALEYDVWLVDGGRGRFLTSLLSHPDEAQRDIIRFDEGCMQLASSGGASRMTLLRLLHPRTRAIDWEACLTLVMDNWRTLHARERVAENDTDRVLERALVAGP